jgi:glycosyltransferase involved in cell wall biosynthesis
MKILHNFSFFSLRRGGGTVDLIYKLSKAQAQRGHDVAIYTTDYDLDRDYINSLKGVHVVPFHSWLNISPLYFFFAPAFIREIRRSLREFDVVHLHCLRSFDNLVISHYARKYGCPYVVDAHGSAPRGIEGTAWFRRMIRWLFDLFFGNRILKGATFVIAESEVGVREYRELGVTQKKIVLITPLHDFSIFSRLPARGMFREKYNLEGKRIIVFMGRINWVKGLDFLVESFYEVLRYRNDAVLVIVGSDDGYKAELENLIEKLGISNKVLFTGFLNGQDKLSALVDADVFVQTSRYEQGAWAPYEAVMCNVPIIVSDNSGAGEDVKKMDTGYLVKFGNKEDLADKIQYVLNNPDKAAEKTRKAKEYIVENLSLERGIHKYEQVYETCVREKRTGRSKK